ncbi:MAG: zinc dependent phospholipase C family protein [Acidobacteriia bacterium]|nr:zinc dependent phospholipase C family protein [Terriglobia bacterium]
MRLRQVHHARRKLTGRAVALLLFFLICPGFTSAYSVLTHEQIVDLLWKEQIQPLLLKRFPASTEAELRQAHAYAYGGCMLQDMGYYPFGNKYFSDLVHYVRSGDFVAALIRDSADLNQYAFALGALAHYASDNSGHPFINQAVAIDFPKLRAKYGDQVTYAADHKAHIRVEFGFDMVQVAKNRFTSDRYHDFIGFEVSTPVLERAFFETYGLRLEEVFSDLDLAIGTYRRSVSKIIPEMTRVALLSRRDEIVKETPNFDKKKFRYYLKRADYRREWGSVYRRPGLGSRILAFFLNLVPKVGPFSALGFKIPNTQTEDLYIKSMNETIENYGHLLTDVDSGDLQLPDRDFDTGRDTTAGEYVLTDRTYARLLDDLAKKNFDQLSPELRDNILHFYADLNAPIATKRDKDDWQRTLEQLDKLKAIHAQPQPREVVRN